jgi:glucose-6-phosphate isomerase
MDSIQFNYKESCGTTAAQLKERGQKLIPEIKKIQEALTKGYDTDYASLNLPTDIHAINHIKSIVEEKKQLKPSIMVVIGIGGSNLGALAIHEAINGKLYNEKNPKLKVYWADTVDTSSISTIAQFINECLADGGNIILNVISKSGATTETIANFQALLKILKTHKPEDYFRYVVATTDKDSKLWNISQEEKFSCLEIPKHVGGRYSVFSAVGLFPLGMLDVHIDELVAGARSIIPECTDENIFDSPAGLSAVLLEYHYRHGKNIHDTFVFSPDLESVGKWYRQLLGESIGKEFNKQGKKIEVGITPTVSVGSTDLHSVGQLYLGGPRDKFTTFVNFLSFKTIEFASVPYLERYDELVPHIQGKFLVTIMQSIFEGIQKTYKQRNLPYVTFLLQSNDPFYIGQFLQCKMLEMMYLGYLLDINPFDQPNVELYKNETREILEHYKSLLDRTDY